VGSDAIDEAAKCAKSMQMLGTAAPPDGVGDVSDNGPLGGLVCDGAAPHTTLPSADSPKFGVLFGAVVVVASAHADWPASLWPQTDPPKAKGWLTRLAFAESVPPG